MSTSKTKYQVVHRLLMDKQYEAGDPITLSDEDAKPLLETNPPVISLPGKKVESSSGNKTNVVKLKTAPEENAERITAIKEAIGQLNKKDESHWTKNNEPDANVLTEMLGWKVKAEERDQAWMEILESAGQG